MRGRILSSVFIYRCLCHAAGEYSCVFFFSSVSGERDGVSQALRVMNIDIHSFRFSFASVADCLRAGRDTSMAGTFVVFLY